MFGYKVYRAFDGLIKHDMMFKDDSKITLVDFKRVVEPEMLSEMFITLLSSNIQIKNLNNES